MPFPFDLPVTSLTYMLLYLATFVTHHLSMHFVVAGCLTILGASIWYGTDQDALLAAIQVVSRSLVWLSVAFVSMSSVVTAQLAYLREGTATDEDLPAVGWLRWLALTGLGLFAVASLSAIGASIPGFAAVNNGSGYLWVGLGLLLWGGQIALWHSEAMTTSRRWIGLRLGLLAGMLFCGAVVRELIRVASIDFSALIPMHEEAGEVQGFGLFLITAVLVIGLMTLSVGWVRQTYQKEEVDIES